MASHTMKAPHSLPEEMKEGSFEGYGLIDFPLLLAPEVVRVAAQS